MKGKPQVAFMIFFLNADNLITDELITDNSRIDNPLTNNSRTDKPSTDNLIANNLRKGLLMKSWKISA